MLCERVFFSQALFGKDLHPVAGGSETDTLGTVLEREHFSGIDPGNGCPGETVDTDKDVCESDDSLCRSASNGPLEDLVSCARG